ncbi:MAG: hypothetical protein AB7T38_00220 [Nitrospirales bacterium]
MAAKQIKKSQVNTGREGKNIKTKLYIERAILQGASPAQNKNEKAKERYLTRLINECQTLPLAALGGGDELKGEVTLNQVYIELDTQTPRVDTAEEPKGRERVR